MPQFTQYGMRPASLEALDDVVLAEVDDAERRLRPRDRDGRRGARLAMPLEQRLEVDLDELVAVQREDVAALVPLARGELDPAAAAEPLGLLRRHDLRPEARELALEQLALPDGARDDHAVDARAREPADLVRGERPARRPRRAPSAGRRPRRRAAPPCRRRG